MAAGKLPTPVLHRRNLDHKRSFSRVGESPNQNPHHRANPLAHADFYAQPHRHAYANPNAFANRDSNPDGHFTPEHNALGLQFEFHFCLFVAFILPNRHEYRKTQGTISE